MKVKYSNTIKNNFSKELLNDMVRLSYTIIPKEKYHFYSIKELSNDEIQIIHSIPSSGFRSTITRKRNSCENFSHEQVMLMFINSAIYICTEDEFHSNLQ